ncbi:hypothetical protein [Haladaptatus sp. NG-WS-4]
MSSHDVLPFLDDCIPFYLFIWQKYEDDLFTRGALEEEYAEHHGRTEVTDFNSGRMLNLLTAYGLIDKVGDDSYRVQCRPDETILSWREKYDSRIKRLHQRVQVHRRERAKKSADCTMPPRLEYQNESYIGLPFEKISSFDDLLTQMDELLDIEDGRTNLVILAPGTEAGDVQHLTDQLCDESVMTDTQYSVPFEKAGSEVRGKDADDLEFRMYLRMSESTQ